MRRVLAALLVLAALGLPACQPVVYVPQPPPGPVPPPPPPPPPAPDVQAVLDRIVEGATVGEVALAMGAPPVEAPSAAGGPDTARWYVTVGGDEWLVWALFDGGRVARKGASKVEVVR